MRRRFCFTSAGELQTVIEGPLATVPPEVGCRVAVATTVCIGLCWPLDWPPVIVGLNSVELPARLVGICTEVVANAKTINAQRITAAAARDGPTSRHVVRVALLYPFLTALITRVKLFDEISNSCTFCMTASVIDG